MRLKVWWTMQIIKWLPLLIMLGGCSTIPTVHTEPTPVDRVVYSCPPPPIVGQPTLLVPTLTDADKTNYSKVATSYEADIVTLKGLVKTYQTVLDKYKTLQPKENNK